MYVCEPSITTSPSYVGGRITCHIELCRAIGWPTMKKGMIIEEGERLEWKKNNLCRISWSVEAVLHIGWLNSVSWFQCGVSACMLQCTMYAHIAKLYARYINSYDWLVTGVTWKWERDPQKYLGLSWELNASHSYLPTYNVSSAC